MMKAKKTVKKNRYHVYVLCCSDGTYYAGYTTDLKKRLGVHNSGKGAKYLRGRLPAELVYSRSYLSLGDALRAEIEIKGLTRKEKEEFIVGRAHA
jgi:putative endonuclease